MDFTKVFVLNMLWISPTFNNLVREEFLIQIIYLTFSVTLYAPHLLTKKSKYIKILELIAKIDKNQT